MTRKANRRAVDPAADDYLSVRRQASKTAPEDQALSAWVAIQDRGYDGHRWLVRVADVLTVRRTIPGCGALVVIRGFEDRYLVVAADAVEPLLASLGVPGDLR